MISKLFHQYLSNVKLSRTWSLMIWNYVYLQGRVTTEQESLVNSTISILSHGFGYFPFFKIIFYNLLWCFERDETTLQIVKLTCEMETSLIHTQNITVMINLLVSLCYHLFNIQLHMHSMMITCQRLGVANWREPGTANTAYSYT